MGQDPAEIRRQIEETREHMGETVGALGYKADVPARTRNAVSSRASGFKERITGTADRVTEATPNMADAKRQARRTKGLAQENPLGLAVGSVAVGFLLGLVLPSTRVEDERLGPLADDAKEAARDLGQEALERGKQVTAEAASSAKDSVSDSSAEQAEGLRASAQSKAEDVRDTARQS